MSSTPLLPLIGTPGIIVPKAPTTVSAAMVSSTSLNAKINFTLPLDTIPYTTGIQVVSSPFNYVFDFLLSEAHLNLTTGQGYVIVENLTGYRQNYKFKVSGTNIFGIGAASNYTNVVTTPLGPPSKPYPPVVTITGDTSLSVAFNEVTGYGVTKYVLSETDNKVPQKEIINTNAAVYTSYFSDLPRQTSYTFKVTAVNTSGSSPQSNASNTVTTKAFSVPGVCSYFNAIGDKGSMLLSWGVPSDDGGKSITGYGAIATNTGNSATITFNTNGPDAGSNVIWTSVPSGTYNVNFFAKNILGNGAPLTKNSVIVTSLPIAGGSTGAIYSSGSFTVPAGFTEIVAVAVGAGGNGDKNISGGGGLVEAARIQVTALETLTYTIGTATPTTTDTVLSRGSTPLLTAKSAVGSNNGGLYNNGIIGWYRGGASAKAGSTLISIGISWTQTYGGNGYATSRTSAGLNIGGGGGPGVYFTSYSKPVQVGYGGLDALNVNVIFNGKADINNIVRIMSPATTSNWDPAVYGYTYDFTNLGWYAQDYIGLSSSPLCTISGVTGPSSPFYVSMQYSNFSATGADFGASNYFKMRNTINASDSTTQMTFNYYNDKNKGDPYNSTGVFPYAGSGTNTLGTIIGGIGGCGGGGGAGQTGGVGGAGMLQIYYGTAIPDWAKNLPLIT